MRMDSRAASLPQHFSAMERRASRALSIGFEGGLYQGDISGLIDDLYTSGGREIVAAERLKVTGLDVRDVVALIDREGGAREWANTSPDPPLPDLISNQRPSKVTYDAYSGHYREYTPRKCPILALLRR